MADRGESTTELARVVLDDDFQEILKSFQMKTASFTPEKRWLIIYHLLKSLMGEEPREAAVLDPSGKSYVIITPPHTWFERAARIDFPFQTSDDDGVDLSAMLAITDAFGHDPDLFKESVDNYRSPLR